MEALEAILSRKSTRAYKSDPVDLDRLNRILEAGRQAPSGGNSQLSHFLVIRGREVLRDLAGKVEKAFAAMEATEDTYPSLKGAIAAAKKGGYVFHYNAPVLIVVCNRPGYGNNIADIACAIENMMIAANALDLGSCWINQLKWLNEDPGIIETLRAFGMHENELPYGAVAIGTADTESGLPNRHPPTAIKGNEVTWVE